MTSPNIPWMGGKHRLATRLIPLFPPQKCYVEVFAGSAALFFLRPHPAKVEVLNDINGDLVCLYRVVQNHLEEFVRHFKWALSSRQIFEWQKMTRPEALTDIQRAARFFYLSTMLLVARFRGRASVLQQQLLQSTCCASKKSCPLPGSACPVPTLKTCLGLSGQSVTTGRTPSTTWTRLTGRRRVMAWTSQLKTMSAYLILCGAAKAR